MPDLLDRLKTALADRYRVEREIGRGGMAHVFLAQDLKLDRPVALKVLRPDVAAVLGGERFLREITLAAKLEHPHILGIHDSGEADGILYYVMPYVEGESLRGRLSREKQLPLDDALQIAREVADVLSYAHARGVIHRDIKPENILLEAGHAVVADFGIARAVDQAGGERLTGTGVALGTPAYMSPEQAAGSKDLDGRSDLYSLGCVLYEMLAGQPPFLGPTIESLVHQHLTAEAPNIASIRSSVPVWVANSVAQSLSKTPADRSLELAIAPRSVAPRRSWGSVALVSTAFVGLFAALWAFGIGHGRDPTVVSPERIALQMPLAQSVADAPDLIFDLSPDGRTFVFVGQSREGQQLYRQQVSGLEAEPIAGTVGARAPSFSPDGQFVAFVAGGSIHRLPVGGGPPTEILSAPGTVQGITWADNGTIIFAPGSASGLVAVPENGGDAISITQPDSGIGVYSHRWPQALPDDAGVLFTAWTGQPESARIAAFSQKARAVVYLVHGVTGRYLASGHLLYATSDGRLEVRRLDLKTLTISSDAHVVARGVRTSPAAMFAVSHEGTLVYMTQETAQRRLVIVDRTGSPTVELPLSGDISDPRFSPDGTSLAFTERERGLASVWVYDLENHSRTRLTTAGENIYPLWSPDGRRLVFGSSHAGRIDLRWIGLSEGGAPQTLLDGPGDKVPETWSPDGRDLVFRQTGSGTGRDIWRLSLMSDAAVTEVRVTAADERSSALSPDGRWLAYVSDESGRDEVYVTSYRGPPGQWQVSAAGGSEPAWSPAGDELFYRSGRGLYRAQILKEGFAITSRDLLFEGSFMANPFRTNYDVHPDGQRFVFVERAQARIELVVMLNWSP